MGVQALSLSAAALAGLMLGAGTPARLLAQHGDAATPVDLTGLEPLGAEWRTANPYRGDRRAVEAGKSAYNQYCARCHGLEGISGGFAPDLRRLAPGDEGDALFQARVRGGVVRNGITYMPKMADVLPQEILWAIRTYLETIHVE